jgi:hypothetical protein
MEFLRDIFNSNEVLVCQMLRVFAYAINRRAHVRGNDRLSRWRRRSDRVFEICPVRKFV